MNKCKIIEDLLPLYVEDMVSEDTKIFIENHIENCDDCKEKLKSLKNEISNEDLNEKAPLEFLNKEIEKDKKFTTMIRVSIVGIILVLFFHFMLTPKFYPFYDDLMDVNETENSFVIELNYPGRLSYESYSNPNSDENEYIISAYKTRFDKFMPEKEKEVLILEKPGILEYDQNDGTNAIDIKTKSEIKMVLLPKLAQNYYLFMAIIASIIVIIIGFIFRKKIDKLIYLILVPISYVISHFLIYRFRGITHTLPFDFLFTLGISIFVYLLLLGIFKKYILNKKH